MSDWVDSLSDDEVKALYKYKQGGVDSLSDDEVKLMYPHKNKLIQKKNITTPLADAEKATQEWVEGWPAAIGGLGQAVGGVFAGMPSMIAGGALAAGSLLKDTPSMITGGKEATEKAYEKAGKLLEETTKSNFGFGQFKPWTKQGEETTKQVTKILEAPRDILGAGGEFVGGSGGRLVGEIAGDVIANFVSPAGAYAAGRAGMRKLTTKTEPLKKPQTTAEKIRAEAAAKEAAKATETSPDMRDVDIAGYDQVLREPGSFNPYDVGGHVSKAREGIETIVDPEAQRTLFDTEVKPEEGAFMDQIRAQEVLDTRQRELEQGVAQARQRDEAITDVAHRRMGPADEVTTRAAQLFDEGGGTTNLRSGFTLEDIKRSFTFGPKLENALYTSEDGTYIPNNPNTSIAIEEALKQGKDGKQWNMLQSGSTSVAMKTDSPIIKAASEIIQNGVKRADLLIRNSIFPTEQSIKRLSREDITTLAEIFKDEMKSGKRYDGDILGRNLSIKQIEAYTDMRKMFDDALDAQNAARLAKGQDPIKPMEAYMASRWQGDFRRPIYEKTKDGQKLVWYLAANTRRGLENQTKALLVEFPDLIVDPKRDHVVRSSTSKTELESMYTKMLDILGRDDPAIQKIQKAIEEQEAIRGAGALGQEKHFEKKAGVRGFVGDRPGTNPRSEAIAMFQQQIQYAKNAYRWSELQKAADDIKAIVSDPRLQEQQPNNIKYIREYFKNAVGMGEGKAARMLDDTLRDSLGVSPTLLNKAVGDLKSFFILQKLAASAGYTIANLIQTSNVMPYLAQMAGAGYHGNPITAVLNGTLQGMAMGTWHYARALGGARDIPLPNQFMKDAFIYAEDNGVISRSVYDESPIQASFGVIGGAANIAAKTMTIPESFVRSVAFMTYANMLKSSGKIKDNTKMFQMAEEYVNKSMVDYRETERPLIFSKLGAAGNFANTLQTYPMSFYNQYAYMAKQAAEGNPWGLGAMLVTHYAVAGAMGIPGFEDMDKLYKIIRDNALPTDMWAKVMRSPFFSDPKLWMMENLGNASVYGELSDRSGIGLTSRVSAPGAGAMLQSPVGPMMDIGTQLLNAGKAALDPTNKEKLAQVGMGSLPTGLQGLLETSDFMKDYTFVERPDGTKVFMKTKDIADRKGGYARTPEEIRMRKLGLRSQKEVVERDVTYATSNALYTQAKKSGQLIDQYYSAMRRGDMKKATKLNELYIELTGSEEGIKDRDIENQIKEEFMTDLQRSKSTINTVNKAKAIARMNKILER